MEKLQIAFDGKRAVRNSTGLGNYSRYAIEALSATYPGHDYAVMSPGAAPRALPPSSSVRTSALSSHPKPSIDVSVPFGAPLISPANWPTWA